MPLITPAAIVQNCYVVADLDAACARLHRLYGIGPFVGGVEFQLDQHFYRGKPEQPIRARGVFVQSGELNLELIELLSETPSAFHDMYPNGAEGLHHVAFFSANYEAERDRLVGQGCPVSSEFTTAFGAKICYLDARSSLGHMIELYPENRIIRAMYKQARREAAAWRGSPLIVPWD